MDIAKINYKKKKLCSALLKALSAKPSLKNCALHSFCLNISQCNVLSMNFVLPTFCSCTSSVQSRTKALFVATL